MRVRRPPMATPARSAAIIAAPQSSLAGTLALTAYRELGPPLPPLPPFSPPLLPPPLMRRGGRPPPPCTQPASAIAGAATDPSAIHCSNRRRSTILLSISHLLE